MRIAAAAEPRLRGRLVVRLARPCVGPHTEGRLPLEAAWDAKAAAELAEAGARLASTSLGLRFDCAMEPSGGPAAGPPSRPLATDGELRERALRSQQQGGTPVECRLRSWNSSGEMKWPMASGPAKALLIASKLSNTKRPTCGTPCRSRAR